MELHIQQRDLLKVLLGPASIFASRGVVITIKELKLSCEKKPNNIAAKGALYQKIRDVEGEKRERKSWPVTLEP